MKIKREALITILQNRLRAWEDDRKQRYNTAVKDWQAAEREYDKRTANVWLDFAATIQRKIGEGKLVAREDIPKEIKTNGSWTGLELFDKKKPTPPTPRDEETQLLRLIEILKNSTDDEVSTYALEKLGFPLGRVLK